MDLYSSEPTKSKLSLNIMVSVLDTQIRSRTPRPWRTVSHLRAGSESARQRFRKQYDVELVPLDFGKKSFFAGA